MSDTKPLKVLDLFSGFGRFSSGLERAGFQTAAFCEVNPYARRVLAKHWPDVPCYDDVTTLTAGRLAADGISVDAICGGFPCQDISYAGPGLGLRGDRSGLWHHYARLIGELLPMGLQYVVVENVSALLGRGMGEILGTLSDLGFDAEWSTVSACAMGYTHMRRRLFIVAYADRKHGRERLRHSLARQDRALQAIDGFARTRARQEARLAHPSRLYGGADGVPFGLERNHGIGNSLIDEIPELIGRAILDAREVV